MTLLFKSNVAFTDSTLPILTLDPLVITGTVFRYDFINSYSNPLADGAITNGAVFKNLVDGGLDATYSAGGTGTGITNAANKKGLVLPGSNGGTNYVIAPVGAYDMHGETADQSHVLHQWFRQDTSGNLASISLIHDRSGGDSPHWGANPSQPSIFVTADATRSYGFMRVDALSVSTAEAAANTMQGASRLLSVSYNATNGLLSYYIDKVLIASATYANYASKRLPPKRSHNLMTFGSNPAANDTVTINGTVITFVSSGATGNQVNIGADASATAQAFKTFVNTNRTALGAFAEGSAAAIVVINIALTNLALSESSSAITLGTLVGPRSLRLAQNMAKGVVYCVSMENLTISGRAATTAIAAEYDGYKPVLTAAGL